MNLTATDRTFYRSIVTLTLPIAIQNLISYSVGMMDTIMLGELGEIALSASALANQLFFIYTIACFGVAGGAVVLCSQYWGKGDVLSIQKVTTISLKITLTVGVLVTALVALCPAQLMGIFTNEAPVIEAGVGYLRVVCLSYIFYGVTSTFLVIYRSVETVNISVVIYSVSFVVNVFFNYCFIFGKLGAPALGVTGAAVGTVLARISEFIMMLVYTRFWDQKIRYRLPMLALRDSKILRDILRYGLPVMLNELIWAVGMSMHSVIMGHMGSAVVAANSICNVVYQMVTSFIMGVSNASAVIIGKAIGSDAVERAKEYAKKFVFIYLLMGVASSAVMLLIKDPIIALYNIEASTRQIAGELMWAYSAAIFFMAFCCPIITGILRGAGDTRYAMLVDCGCMWFCIPFGAIAAFWFQLPAVGVFLVLRVDMVLKTFFCLWRLRGDQWIWNVTK